MNIAAGNAFLVAGDAEPTVTDWMSAWGTVGALAVSLLLGFTSIVLAYNDRRAKRESERMELARVFARVETDDDDIRWSITNASPYPIRQAHIMAVSFGTNAVGTRTVGGGGPQFSGGYIPAGATARGSRQRNTLPDPMRLVPGLEAAVRLDFIDYQGTHWVRAANGKATTVENLKGVGFEKLPRTLSQPDRTTLWSRSKARVRRLKERATR